MPVMFPLHAGLATHESLFVPAWYGVAPQDRAIVRQEAIAGANDYARARRRGRFELRSMDWMISSSAARSLFEQFRRKRAGLYVTNGGYDGPRGEEAIKDGRADAIAYGRAFLAKP